MRGWALLVLLSCVPALAGCIGEAGAPDGSTGFVARYERIGENGDPVWHSGYDVELSYTMAKDREGTVRPAYRVTTRSLERDAFDAGLASTEVLDGSWRVVRTDTETLDGTPYTSSPNLRIAWEDGAKASSTGVGWVQSLRHLPSVPVGDGGSVDVFRGESGTQVRIHYPRPDEPGGWPPAIRTAVYFYEPDALLPSRIVESHYMGGTSERRLTRFEPTDGLGPVAPWPLAPPRTFAPAPRPGLVADLQADPLELGYPLQEVLDTLAGEDGEADRLLRHGCLYDYAIHFDRGFEDSSPTVPVLYTRTHSDLHDVGLGDRQGGSARWSAQRYTDGSPAGGSGFEVERSGAPPAPSPCMATATMPVPEMGLGGFLDRLAAVPHGPLKAVRAHIEDPQDPLRPVPTGWTRFEATFEEGQSVLRIAMDAHQAWWTEALVLGADAAAFDTPSPPGSMS